MVNIGDGREMLKATPTEEVRVAFFDPQYRAMLDKQAYGKETGKQAALPAMPPWMIKNMIIELERVLKPSGYLFLWIDKFMLVEGVKEYLGLTDLHSVDMITWDKMRLGMGYRSRRRAEYLVVLQKNPVRAKSTWWDHGIPDVWPEMHSRAGHPHAKPVGLIERLLMATTKEDDLVVDPCAGSFAVLTACQKVGRSFLGTDLVDPATHRKS